MKKPNYTRSISVLSLYLIVMVTILSLREYPIMATQGWHCVCFYLLGFIFFLLPSALICAELASHYPIQGGLYSWVKIAFGKRTGFMVMWVEWINNLISFPATLAMIVATLGYVLLPSLPHDHGVFFALMLVACWSHYFISAKGVRISSRLSFFGAIIGILIPSLSIIVLGIRWAIIHPVVLATVHLSSLLPQWNVHSLAVFVTVLSSFAGMQAAAFYAQDVKQTSIAYPKAMLWGSLSVLLLAIGGTLALVLVIPTGKVNFITGLVGGFDIFFSAMHLPYLTLIIALTIALAAMTSMNAWLTALARGMQQMAMEHTIPAKLATLNRHGMPTRILFLQCSVVTGIACIFWVTPQLRTAFWLLIALTSQLTVLMYIGLFCSAIKLRFNRRISTTGFAIPGGNTLIVLCGLCGLGSALIGFLCGFLPPAGLALTTGHYATIMLTIDGLILAAAWLYSRYQTAPDPYLTDLDIELK